MLPTRVGTVCWKWYLESCYFWLTCNFTVWFHSPIVAADPDFNLPDPFTLTFDTMSVNGSSDCVNIDIPQDQALEGDHDFTVRFSTFSPDLVIVVPPEAADSEIIIADDDSMCAIVCRCMYVPHLCGSVMLANATYNLCSCLYHFQRCNPHSNANWVHSGWRTRLWFSRAVCCDIKPGWWWSPECCSNHFHPHGWYCRYRAVYFVASSECVFVKSAEFLLCNIFIWGIEQKIKGLVIPLNVNLFFPLETTFSIYMPLAYHISISVQALTPKLNLCSLPALITTLVILTTLTH